MEANLTFGMSADFPMDTGVFHMIRDGSISIFNDTMGGKQVTKKLRNCAGISNHNAMHKFQYFNGKKDKP